MQLTLGFENSPLLPRLRSALLEVFGPRPATTRLDPLSQVIHSQVGARTPESVSYEAFMRLRDAFPDWAELANASPKRIEEAIAQVAHADRKARQLPTLIRVIQIRAGGLDLGFLGESPVEEAMEWLQSLPGVGARCAAATLNFSSLNRRILVVDAPVHRVIRRLGLAARGSDPAQACEALMGLVPQDWTADDLFELHWLVRGLGQSVCAEAAPRCGMCRLKASCPRVGIGVGRKVIDLAEARWAIGSGAGAASPD